MRRIAASPLDCSTVARIGSRIATPGYDRSQLSVGIVHFGVGGFHRAHQAMYIDSLMNAGEAFDWAICGVGVLAADRPMQEALEAQGYLYTMIAKHSDGVAEPRVIGSIVDYLFAPDDPEAVVARLADEATRIVSLTVTEGAYGIDDVTGEFRPRAADVVHDLEPGALPQSFFGMITDALTRRRGQALAPFTIVSCDNLEGNGRLARKAFAGFARARDPELGDWVERHVPFPNSMVDRITPATTDGDREDLRLQFGVQDRWPVVCEPFTQWVIEDSFACGRPPLEHAGVQVVGDVAPYETMKLRLLNGGHQALCYFAYLCGHVLVHEGAEDPLLRSFVRGYMDQEATPTLDPVPGVDLEEYKSTLMVRFSNPEIRDTIARLCAESSDRIPKWLLPVVRSQLQHGGEVRRSAAIIASWARYAEGVDERGEPIVVVDRRRDKVMALAARQRQEPLAFIADRELFGDLSQQPRFVDAYLAAMRSLYERGARATLVSLVTELG
jgi:mannitol 2-dehydrogenase